MAGHDIADCWFAQLGFGTIAVMNNESSYVHENQFRVFENLCNFCNCHNYSCQTTSISEINVSKIDSVTVQRESSDNVTRAARKSNNTDQVCTNSYFPSCNPSSQPDNMQTNNINPFSINLKNKGYNFGHLNIQGICGNNLCKFSELSILNANFKRL